MKQFLRSAFGNLRGYGSRNHCIVSGSANTVLTFSTLKAGMSVVAFCLGTARTLLVGSTSLFLAAIGLALSVLAALIDNLLSPYRSSSPLVDYDAISARRNRNRLSAKSANSATTQHETETNSNSDSSTTLSNPHTAELVTLSTVSDAPFPEVISVQPSERSPKHGKKCPSRDRKKRWSQGMISDAGSDRAQHFAELLTPSTASDIPSSGVVVPSERSPKHGKMCLSRDRKKRWSQGPISDAASDGTLRKVGSHHFLKSKSLRKTPSGSSVAAGALLSSEKKKSLPMRPRTHPYEAPYFLPTPDTVTPALLSPPRQKPIRSQTLPP